MCTTKSNKAEQENNRSMSLFNRCTPRRPATEMTTVYKPKPMAPYANHAPSKLDGFTGFQGTGAEMLFEAEEEEASEEAEAEKAEAEKDLREAEGEEEAEEEEEEEEEEEGSRNKEAPPPLLLGVVVWFVWFVLLLRWEGMLGTLLSASMAI